MASKKRIDLPKSGKLLHNPVGIEDHHFCYEATIAMALRRELSAHRYRAKILMLWTGAGGRTVRNWLGGVRGPSGIHLILLMGNSNEVFEAVLHMAGRMPERSPSNLCTARGHAAELLNLLDQVLAAPDRQVTSDRCDWFLALSASPQPSGGSAK